MIDKALTIIVSELKSKMGLEGGKLNYLQSNTDQLGKVLCSVSHINMGPVPSRGVEGPTILQLGFHLNFQSNFEASAYPEGLKHLSTIQNHLYHNPILNSQNSPNLPSEISKIALSQIEAPATDANLPLVVFEVRILISDSVRGDLPPVEPI